MSIFHVEILFLLLNYLIDILLGVGVLACTVCGAVPNIDVLFPVWTANGLGTSLFSATGFCTTLGSTFCGTFSLDFSFSTSLGALSVLAGGWVTVFRTSGTIGLGAGVEVFMPNKFVRGLSGLVLTAAVLLSPSGSPVSLDFGLPNIDVDSLFSGAKGLGSGAKAGSLGSVANACVLGSGAKACGLESCTNVCGWNLLNILFMSAIGLAVNTADGAGVDVAAVVVTKINGTPDYILQ